MTGGPASDTARAEILARIRAALAPSHHSRLGAGPGADPAPSAGHLLETHAGPLPTGDAVSLAELFIDRLADYGAGIARCDEAGVAAALSTCLTDGRTPPQVIVPPGLNPAWIPAGAHTDGPELGPLDLDGYDAVVTECRLAIAETGTIVLDAAPGQGRRAVTLIPDHHVCVVRPAEIVADVGDALARLDPARPLTWISGPSATSDIELQRVAGVHGPRRLDVILIHHGATET